MAWDVEEIPDEDMLFMRAHKSNFKLGKLLPGVFKPKPTDSDGMSTNWNKYCRNADECRQTARNPVDNAVLVGRVVKVREAEFTVLHAPTDDRSHSEIYGDITTTKSRLALLEIFSIELALP